MSRNSCVSLRNFIDPKERIFLLFDETTYWSGYFIAIAISNQPKKKLINIYRLVLKQKKKYASTPDVSFQHQKRAKGKFRDKEKASLSQDI